MKTEKAYTELTGKTVKTIIWLLIAYAVYFGLWTVFFTETGNGDNVEHIHATWLVAQGKIPYRDFFQHHNPLLWYIFAPVIGHFTNVLSLLDAAHAVALGVGLFFLFVVYKLCRRFFASKYATLLSLLILCPPYYYVYCFNYNPDTFMALFFAAGLYYLFAYMDSQKLQALVLSFIFFFIAFLFTQKILTVLLPLGIVSVVVLYKEKVKITDVCCAMLLPVFGFGLFIVLLYYTDTLEIYWKSNYLFNVRMQDYYGVNKINVLDGQMLLYAGVAAGISAVFLFRREHLFYKITAVLFALEVVQRCFYFSIAPYYMLPLIVFMAILNSVLIDKMIKKRYWFLIFILPVGIYYAYISHERYLSARTVNRSFAEFISANITPCDYVISSFLGSQSIMNKDPHYYWALLGHIDIAGEELGIAEKPNLNQLVVKYKPKLVTGDIYWNNYYLNRGQRVFVQRISPDILERYYLPSPFPGMYILKYEYRGKDCHYDHKRGDWVYAE